MQQLIRWEKSAAPHSGHFEYERNTEQQGCKYTVFWLYADKEPSNKKMQTENSQAYLSGRMTSQRVDGKVDVQVELQALRISICISNLRGNIIVPQFKKHFVISIVKRAEEVLLQKKGCCSQAELFVRSIRTNNHIIILDQWSMKHKQLT